MLAAEAALTAAQAALTSAKAVAKQHDDAYASEEAKLLAALACVPDAPTPVQSHPPPPSPPRELSQAELLERFSAFAASADGRAALAVRGVVIQAPVSAAGEDFQPTQPGNLCATEADVDRLVAGLDPRMAQVLAARLTQPGVVESSPPTQKLGGGSAAGRGRSPRADGSTSQNPLQRRENSNSRSERGGSVHGEEELHP